MHVLLNNTMIMINDNSIVLINDTTYMHLTIIGHGIRSFSNALIFAASIIKFKFTDTTSHLTALLFSAIIKLSSMATGIPPNNY